LTTSSQGAGSGVRRTFALAALLLAAACLSGCGLRRAVLGPELIAPPFPSQETTSSHMGEALDSGGMPALIKRFGQPSASFRMPDMAQSGETSETLVLPDGHRYICGWGFDAAGKAIVVRHVVLTSESATLTPADRAFVSAIRDGSTPLSVLNAYVARVSRGTFRPAPEGAPTNSDVVWLWLEPDGSGMFVNTIRTDRSLAMAHYKGVPYFFDDWPPNHQWIVGAPGW
jgi:hypothetical protein